MDEAKDVRATGGTRRFMGLVAQEAAQQLSPPTRDVRVLCTRCGYVGKPERVTKGSFWIELLLWLAFIFPGLLYSAWRLTTRYRACAKCGSGEIIPVDSPVAQKLLGEQARL